MPDPVCASTVGAVCTLNDFRFGPVSNYLVVVGKGKCSKTILG